MTPEELSGYRTISSFSPTAEVSDTVPDQDFDPKITFSLIFNLTWGLILTLISLSQGVETDAWCLFTLEQLDLIISFSRYATHDIYTPQGMQINDQIHVSHKPLLLLFIMKFNTREVQGSGHKKNMVQILWLVDNENRSVTWYLPFEHHCTMHTLHNAHCANSV